MPAACFRSIPNRSEIWGAPCFPNLGALPEPPDHLAIFTPAETTIARAARGRRRPARAAPPSMRRGLAKAATTKAAGWARPLRAALAETGIAAVGPNCMGVACGASRFATIPDETLQELAPSPVALVGAERRDVRVDQPRDQRSRPARSAISPPAAARSAPPSATSSITSPTQPKLKVILCYIEAIPDAEHFLAAARRARANGKTVVAVKIGGSEGARAAALAHTGSLAGRAEVFEAFAAAAGIVRAQSLEDAIEAVEFLARAPLPRGGRIAAMTNSGAQTQPDHRSRRPHRRDARRLSSDPTRDSAAHERSGSATSPIRSTPSARSRPRNTPACLDALVDAPEIDIVLAAEELPLRSGRRAPRRQPALARSLRRSARQRRARRVAVFTPLLASTTDYGRAVRAELPHVPVLRETERTLRVLKALARCRRAGRCMRREFFAPPIERR